MRVTELLVLILCLTLISVANCGPYNGLNIPTECADNPFFADCSLIVRSKFCNHKYYSEFCCKSCIQSGQLDPMRTLHQPEGDYWT